MPKRRTLSVALLGTKFMGRAHSNAWRQAPRFFDLPANIQMAAICGRDHADTRRAAKVLGWERAVDENFPMIWRLQSKVAGSGALGDIGAHIIDLARFLVGEIATVSAVSETFVKRRLTKSRSYARVDVDDAVSVVGKFKNGAMLNLEATRFARGRKNQLAFEINGSRGSLAFDLEEMNRLRFYDASDPEQMRGFHDIIVT